MSLIFNDSEKTQFKQEGKVDLPLACYGNGNTIYSLREQRKFYESNNVLIKQSRNLRTSIKFAHRTLVKSLQEFTAGSGKPPGTSKKAHKKKAPKLNQTSEDHKPKVNQANLTQPTTTCQPSIIVGGQLTGNTSLLIDSDLTRTNRVQAPEIKRWELLKYKGSKYTPQSLLKITKRRENKHGKNVHTWSQVRQKNNNIDYDAKKSFENLKRRIDTSDRTVSRIKYGGLSMFEQAAEEVAQVNEFRESRTLLSQDKGLKKGSIVLDSHDLQGSAPLKPNATLYSTISQTQTGCGFASIAQKVNIPILDVAEYRECLSHFAKSTTPGKELESTDKKWYQYKKTKALTSDEKRQLSNSLTSIAIATSATVQSPNAQKSNAQAIPQHSHLQTGGQNTIENEVISPKVISKKLDFPINPTFFPQEETSLQIKRRKLKSAIDFCKKKKIPMNEKDSINLNVRRSQNTFHKFQNTVEQVYSGKSIDEGNFYLQKLKNYRPQTSKETSTRRGETSTIREDLSVGKANQMTQSAKNRQGAKGSISYEQGSIYIQNSKNSNQTNQNSLRLSMLENYNNRFEELEAKRQEKMKNLESFLDKAAETNNSKIFNSYGLSDSKSLISRSNKSRCKSASVSRKTYSRGNDGTFQILRSTKANQKNKQNLSQSLNEILHRLQLDRPILFNEKLDVIWNTQMVGEEPERPSTSYTQQTNNGTQSANATLKSEIKKSVDASRNIRNEIDRRKKERDIQNTEQKGVYKRLLTHLYDRSLHPLKDELQLLDIIKIILNGGWIITREEFSKLLEILQIPNETQKNSKQFMGYLNLCIDELNNALFAY